VKFGECICCSLYACFTFCLFVSSFLVTLAPKIFLYRDTHWTIYTCSIHVLQNLTHFKLLLGRYLGLHQVHTTIGQGGMYFNIGLSNN
jgi:hypothetical protein